MRLVRCLAVLLVLCAVVPSTSAETVDELLTAAGTALKNGKAEQSLGPLGKAIALDPKSIPAYRLRAIAHDALGKHTEALADLNKAVELDPKIADIYDKRGSTHFKLRRFKESLADFDKFLQLSPKEGPGHWRRGITCYYAARFDEGRKQFEGYEQVDTNDVENAVWHFLCVARASGVDKARAALLKIGKDGRIPMMEVYALYGGKAKPEDVLAAAQAGDLPAEQRNFRLFYAHLYLGLYYEILADKKKTLEHMALAAEKYKIRHYMGDVAQVHLEVLRAEQK